MTAHDARALYRDLVAGRSLDVGRVEAVARTRGARAEAMSLDPYVEAFRVVWRGVLARLAVWT